MLSTIASVLNAARDASARGHIKQSRHLYREVLKVDRVHPQALLELAVLEGQSGHPDTARKLLLRAVRQMPENADAHYNLGQADRALNQAHRALEHFRITYSLNRSYPGIHYAIGEALLVSGQARDAQEWLEVACANDPQDYDAILAYALSLEQDDRSKSLQLLHQIDPKSNAGALAQYNIARLYTLSGHTDRAIEYFEAAQKLEKMPAQFLAPAAEAYMAQGDLDLARQYATAALKLQPSAAMSALAQIEVISGNFEAAEELLLKALKTRTNRPILLHRLSGIRPLDDTYAPDLAKVLADERARLRSRSLAGFALYSIQKRSSAHDEAFATLRQANDCARQEFPFDADKHEAYYKSVMENFDRELIHKPMPSENDPRCPVFIVGMPRSGTTLVERIVSSNEQTHGLGETAFVSKTAREIADFPHRIRSVDDSERSRLRARLLDRLFEKAGERVFVTDKMPGNYGYLGFIKWLIPNAKFLYCQREPQAVALSIYEQHFGGRLSYAYDLQSIARVFNMHKTLMTHWRDVCGIEYKTVQYEQLVREPGSYAREIYDFLGMEWEPGCLDATRAQDAILTASAWQARQPINTASVERWRRYEEHLRPFSDALETV